MYLLTLFAAAIGCAVAVMIGPAGGFVSGMLVAGAGYAARQIMRED